MSDHEKENQNPNVGGPSSDSGDTRKDEYKVGYCVRRCTAASNPVNRATRKAGPQVDQTPRPRFNGS